MHYDAWPQFPSSLYFPFYRGFDSAISYPILTIRLLDIPRIRFSFYNIMVSLILWVR